MLRPPAPCTVQVAHASQVRGDVLSLTDHGHQVANAIPRIDRDPRSRPKEPSRVGLVPRRGPTRTGLGGFRGDGLRIGACSRACSQDLTCDHTEGLQLGMRRAKFTQAMPWLLSCFFPRDPFQGLTMSRTKRKSRRPPLSHLCRSISSCSFCT